MSMSFSDWINEKYVQWRGNKKGKAASIVEFARLFGASQQVMSLWMQPEHPPRSQKYIQALARVYGREVYEVLGIAVPDDQEISLDELPPALRSRLEAALLEIRKSAASITDKEGPEMEQLASEIFAKHGFRSTRIS